MNPRVGKRITILAILVALLSVNASYAEEVMDYFDPTFKNELSTVERYHLTKETFWRLFESKNYSDALSDLKFILRYFPNHPKALQLMELVTKTIHEPFLAVPYYDRAVRLYPQYAITQAQYGNCLVGIGKTEEGITRLEQAIEINPRLAAAYNWLSEAYTKAGNPEKARQAAEKAKELSAKGEK